MLASLVTSRDIEDVLPHESGVIVSNESMCPIQDRLIESRCGRYELVRLDVETTRAVTFRRQPGCLSLPEHYVFGSQNFARINEMATLIQRVLL